MVYALPIFLLSPFQSSTLTGDTSSIARLWTLRSFERQRDNSSQNPIFQLHIATHDRLLYRLRICHSVPSSLRHRKPLCRMGRFRLRLQRLAHAFHPPRFCPRILGQLHGPFLAPKPRVPRFGRLRAERRVGQADAARAGTRLV